MATTSGQYEIIPTRDDPTLIHRNFRAIRAVFNNLLLSTTLTTKGDLLTYTTTATRKAVGSDGQILFALASESDGLQWRIPDTDDITEATNLYYTDERVDDRVAALVQDSGSVSWSYDDGAGTLTATVTASGIDHGGLSGLGDDDHPQYTQHAGTETITGDWTFGAELTFSVAAQDYKLVASGQFLELRGQSSAQGAELELSAADNDGTDDVLFSVDPIGNTGATDFEIMEWGWDAGNQRYELRVLNQGSGSLRSLAFLMGATAALVIDTSGNIAVSGTVDGRDLATDGTKLDGIESGATADQTDAEILTAIKTVDGTGSGLDADLLDGNEATAFAAASHAANHTNGTDDIQIATASQKGLMAASYKAKLDGIEVGADVTDATNVDAAGAVMHTDVSESQGILRKTASETYEAVAVKWDATAAPTANDDASNTSGNGTFAVGSRWIDVTNDKEYVCLDSTATAAVWTETTGSGGGGVTALEVASISNPSTELNAIAGSSKGELRLCYQVSSGVDIWTLYAWDNAIVSENVPFVVDGSSGAWVAIAGRYTNGAHQIVDGMVAGSYTAATGPAIGEFSTDGTLSGNSTAVVPTEQAVKTYVDSTAVASQAEMEAASSTSKHVTPGRQHYHPGHPKAWVNWNGTGTVAIRDDYNVSSITDNGTGDQTVNYSITMSSTSYHVMASGKATDATTRDTFIFAAFSYGTTSVRVLTHNSSGTAADAVFCNVSVSGDT